MIVLEASAEAGSEGSSMGPGRGGGAACPGGRGGRPASDPSCLKPRRGWGADA